jgi:hypothetical protein
MLSRRSSILVAVIRLLCLITAITTSGTDTADATQIPSMRYFPAGILHANWQTFPVAGYSFPITGVVYRGLPRPTACNCSASGPWH